MTTSDGIRGPESVDWEQLLLVYLHDPVDKALDIRGHESRAARYASRALDRTVDCSEIKGLGSLADQLAAIAERIPMPTAGHAGQRAVGVESGQLEVRHPVSGEAERLDVPTINESAVLDAISSIVDGLDEPRQRFLALWRLLPQRLSRSLGDAYSRLPADTRVPDHTLFHHVDVTSGLWASRSAGAHGGAYLSLSLGPVQPFIEAARSVRDLWSGSAILSWLAFQGMVPVLERYGPTAFVFPALRGNPLMDLWLRKDNDLARHIEIPPDLARRAPSVPNRFVALIPWGQDGCAGRAVAQLCADAVRDAWKGLSDDVLEALDSDLAMIDPCWASRWHQQVGSFFDVQTTVIPEFPLNDRCLADLFGRDDRFEDLWSDAAEVRKLASIIPTGDRPRYSQMSAGRWQAQLEASARLMEAQRSIRHVPSSPKEDGLVPAKCSLLGTYEQVGPAGMDDGRRFWDAAENRVGLRGVRLRSGERFSSLALCKRFSGPATLGRELALDVEALRFPDTATIAAADWLYEAGITPDLVRSQFGSWNGRWLHQGSGSASEDDEEPAPPRIRKRIKAAQEEIGRPAPSYYAILMMDADDMGRWLKGDHDGVPLLRDVLHPKMVRYYERLGDSAKGCLDARRPVGPALHASISEALNSFACQVVPRTVNRHRGTTIYSGGDDVLVLLPARQAVRCAHELEQRFRGLEVNAPTQDLSHEWQLPLTMGSKATLSAGIVIVHMKEDLRLALQAARESEKASKGNGKNALTIRFMRRSGEHAQGVLGWEQAPWFQHLVQTFAAGATDSWCYRLRAELPTLSGEAVPDAAISAEIRRLAKRASEDARSLAQLSAEGVSAWWREFAGADRNLSRKAGDKLADFVAICQGASFVARGDDG